MQRSNRAFSMAWRKSGVKKEEILRGFKEERNIVLTTKEGKLTGLFTSCVATASQNTF
jgi:hypothetical protein